MIWIVKMVHFYLPSQDLLQPFTRPTRWTVADSWYAIISLAGAQPEIFQDRGDFVELGHFNKHFVKNTRKKDPAGKKFEDFSPRYS